MARVRAIPWIVGQLLKGAIAREGGGEGTGFRVARLGPHNKTITQHYSSCLIRW